MLIAWVRFHESAFVLLYVRILVYLVSWNIMETTCLVRWYRYIYSNRNLKKAKKFFSIYVHDVCCYFPNSLFSVFFQWLISKLTYPNTNAKWIFKWRLNQRFHLHFETNTLNFTTQTHIKQMRCIWWLLYIMRFHGNIAWVWCVFFFAPKTLVVSSCYSFICSKKKVLLNFGNFLTPP